MSARLLIVGLGNPGVQYERTRHNLGFRLVDLIAGQAGAQIKRRDCRALVGNAALDGVPVELVKPQTFMNLSGEAVSCLVRKRGIESVADSLVVVSDDVALPFESIRIRRKGSAGGQNGLKSIIEQLGTDEFIRLRIGIRPEHTVSDLRQFVLDEFSRSERARLKAVLETSADALRAIVRDGVERAMASYNS